MRRAAFGALIGENRLLRTYDSLGWSTWGWTEPIILYVPESGVWGYIPGGLSDPDLEVEVPEYVSWDDVPDLNPELIHDVLRQGDKMLVSGPSKAGKSFAMLELAAAIAEGRDWMGLQCTKGRVLYVNLELHDSSCNLVKL